MSDSELITPVLDEITEDTQVEPLDAEVQHMATPKEVGDET